MKVPLPITTCRHCEETRASWAGDRCPFCWRMDTDEYDYDAA